jgi:hypothetical protein
MVLFLHKSNEEILWGFMQGVGMIGFAFQKDHSYRCVESGLISFGSPVFKEANCSHLGRRWKLSMLNFLIFPT